MPRVIAALCALMLLAGCSSAPASSVSPPQSTTPPSMESSSSEESTSVSASSQASTSLPSKNESVPPLDIKDIVVNIDIAEPDRAGYVYMKAFYTNNSKVTIKDISIKVLLKDTNDTTYLSCSDTVLPGETSPNFESFGPKSLSKSDVEFLSCDITVLGSNNEQIWITYDNKTGQMDWIEV